MDDFLLLIALLLSWRVLLSASLAAVLAIVLVNVVSPFSGLQGLVLALMGLLAGIAWQEKAHGSPLLAPPESTRHTPPAVAGLAAFLAGGAWGGLSSTSAGAAAIGALILLVVAAGIYALRVHIFKRQTSTRQALIYSACALAGYAVALVLIHRG